MIESNLHRAPIRVLSVEDDVDYERLIELWLNEKTAPGFRVTPAERLEDVARHFQPGGYDVMLLDLGPSYNGGLDTVTIAREVAWDLPIVVLTADFDSAVPDRVIQSGADGCLIKGSFRPETLVKTIVNAVDGRRAAPVLSGLGVPVIPADGAIECALAGLPGQTLSMRIATGAATRGRSDCGGILDRGLLD